MAGERILVVEDEAIVARDLTVSLECAGYRVVGPACDGAEAIRLARQIPFDAVLIDISLQRELDGLQTAEAIRSIVAAQIIYLTD